MARALRPGGTLVLDYLNHVPAARRLVREETKIVDGIGYRLTRWADACALYKRITIEDTGGPAPLEFVERVARFGVENFRRMGARHGLEITQLFGDYRLGPYESESSPRLIVVLRTVASEPSFRSGERHDLPESLPAGCQPRLS